MQMYGDHKIVITHVGGLTRLSSSLGEVGTLRMTILRPSVEPIPIEARDLMDRASGNLEYWLPQSENTAEPVLVSPGCSSACCCCFRERMLGYCLAGFSSNPSRLLLVLKISVMLSSSPIFNLSGSYDTLSRMNGLPLLVGVVFPSESVSAARGAGGICSWSFLLYMLMSCRLSSPESPFLKVGALVLLLMALRWRGLIPVGGRSSMGLGAPLMVTSISNSRSETLSEYRAVLSQAHG